LKPFEWLFLFSVVGIIADSIMLMDDTARAGALVVFIILALMSGLALFTNSDRS